MQDTPSHKYQRLALLHTYECKENDVKGGIYFYSLIFEQFFEQNMKNVIRKQSSKPIIIQL